jgi:Ca2+-binding RTX toxin-like protein
MSIMKGKLRRSAVVVAFSLGAFQALSIVGANVASAAAVACTFNSGTLTVQFTGAGHTISQDAIGNILVDGLKTSATVPTCTTSLDATIANTTQININGTPGATLTNDAVSILTYKPAPPAACPITGCTTANWGSINWTVNLGDHDVTTAPFGDTFTVDNSLNVDNDIKTDWGVNGVDLNGDGNLDVALVSVEKATDIVGPGTASASAKTTSSTINAGGSTITGGPFPTAITINGAASLTTYLNITGGSGDDTLTGSAASYSTIAGGLGNDSINCGAGDGAVDYSGSATAVVVDLGAGTGTGEGFDSIAGPCDDINGSDHGDTLTGNANWNWIAVGNGADTVDGVSGPNDTYDVASATAAVTVDLGAGTSTGGSGTDTLKHIKDVSGSDFDDSFTGSSGDNVLYGEGGNDTLSGGAGNNDGADSFDGGSGIDTVDYGKNTLGTTVNLAAASAVVNNCPIFDTGTPPNLADCGVGGVGGEDRYLDSTVENAILGTGNDIFTGSAFNNTVWPNGGQNSLNGCPAAILVTCGIDTVNYSQGYDAGVTVNLAGGGPSGGNADSIVGFTNAVGTAFADNIIGTDLNIGNSLKGGKGNDTISGNNGPDFVLGGAGNDAIRGGAGEDTLKGQGGKDNIRGSGGDDDIFGGKGSDFCDGGGGSDFIKTCEKPKHHGQGPNGPGLHQRI